MPVQVTFISYEYIPRPSGAGLLAAVIFLSIIFTACTNKQDRPKIIASDTETIIVNIVKPDPMSMVREEAMQIALSMDDSILAAQCLMAGFDNKAYLTDLMKVLLMNIPAGGIILFKYNLADSREEIRSFLAELSDYIAAYAGVKPFLAVDHEGGMVNRFAPPIAQLPAPAFFWEMAQINGEGQALKAVEDLAALAGGELKYIGINMNLAPVAEVLNAENQAFLETRSYGPNPGFTQEAASAFIRGMESAGIVCAVKHFPGSGADDPHLNVSTFAGNRQALEILIQPFRHIFNRVHVPAVMVSHVMVPAMDAVNNASLSPVIVSSWLRHELGFSGIILADDFSMDAVAGRNISAEEAVVDALNAGVDMVMCWPSNMVSIHNAILAALREERLPRQRLLEAAANIIAEKLRAEKRRAEFLRMEQLRMEQLYNEGQELFHE